MENLIQNVFYVLNKDDIQSVSIKYERQGDIEQVDININKKENLNINFDSYKIDKSWVNKGISKAITEVSK